MPVILYLPQEEEVGKQVLQSIREAIPGQALEIYSSISGLSDRLHQPLPDVHVAVLYASGRAELMEIIYLDDLLGELKVVLILPDSDPDMLEKACILYPRFIAAAKSDFKHLGSVLKKMTDWYSKTQQA